MNTRSPIIVVLGHVDHGKTTLLDYIRKTNVASREAGAITQHIGAYQVMVEPSSRATEGSRGVPSENTKKILRQGFDGELSRTAQDDRVDETHTITFIDTPGHEAFSKMRSRGASVADIALLVVAADDGVMPQTIESIRQIKQAKIPMIVVFNKIDLPGINLNKVKKQLGKEGVALEGYGGDTVSVEISAKTGKGVNDLLEMITLIAEMTKLKGDAKGPLEAVVIESEMDKNRGPVASIIVKNGTLKLQDEIISDKIKGKIKAITDDCGQRLTEVTPGMPAEILGLETIPAVGAIIKTQTDEKQENEEEIYALNIPESVNSSNLLKIILKTDATGTLEAILASLAKKPLQIMGSGTGDINDSDILLAKTTGAIIIGFNIKMNSTVAKLAENEKVKVKTYQIIYELLEEMDEVIEALSKPAEENFLGKAEIIDEFAFSKQRIAGCRTLEGRLALGDKVKILRGDQEIGTAKIKSLRQQKENVSKVELGQECGILFEPQLDFKLQDIVISVR